MEAVELKKFLDENKIQQKDFAKKLNLHRNTVSGWISSKNLNKATLDKISHLIYLYQTLTGLQFLEENKNFENIVREPTAEYIEPNNDSVNKITNYKPTSDSLIPFWDIDFIAGTAFDTVDGRRSNPDYYMDIPDFRGCTAFRAYSDSMEGLIKSGSVLFGTKVTNWSEHLEYGQIYGIVCQDGRKYLKYIKKYREDPNTYFLLESENKFYDEFEMPKEAIRSIWLIHGHLSKRI